jgi:hypothetical protein
VGGTPETFIRFESPDIDSVGRHVGVFGLVNSLGRAGRLTAEQEKFRRVTNAWYDAAYPNPAAVDPTVYDPRVNPTAAAWFKSTSESLLARVEGYLTILATMGVACVRRESTNPGVVIYEDDYQIVLVDVDEQRSLTVQR